MWRAGTGSTSERGIISRITRKRRLEIRRDPKNDDDKCIIDSLICSARGGGKGAVTGTTAVMWCTCVRFNTNHLNKCVSCEFDQYCWVDIHLCQDFHTVTSRRVDHVRRLSKSRGSSGVGTTGVGNLTGRVESGQEAFKSRGSGRITLTPPDP